MYNDFIESRSSYINQFLHSSTRLLWVSNNFYPPRSSIVYKLYILLLSLSLPGTFVSPSFFLCQTLPPPRADRHKARVNRWPNGASSPSVRQWTRRIYSPRHLISIIYRHSIGATSLSLSLSLHIFICAYVFGYNIFTRATGSLANGHVYAGNLFLVWYDRDRCCFFFSSTEIFIRIFGYVCMRWCMFCVIGTMESARRLSV